MGKKKTRRAKIAAVARPLVLDIGGRNVTVHVRTAPRVLKAVGETAIENGKKMKPVEERRDAALEAGDFDEAYRLDGELTSLIEPVVSNALGRPDYEKVLAALGGGEKADPADCVPQLVQVMDAIKGEIENFVTTAAQTTAGASDALQAADRD